MDEQRLSELFRDAAGVAPPPSFDTDDVVGASRRVTARRRSAVAGGSLFGVALLSGGLLFGGQVFQSTSEGRQAAAESAPQAPAAAPPLGDRMLEPTPLLAPPEAADGGPACGLADPELTAGLAEVVGEGPPVAFPEPCPPGFRGVGVAVPGGTVYALLGPAPLRAGEVPGYASVRAGDEVLSVVSVPADPGAPPPLADDLDSLAEELAARL